MLCWIAASRASRSSWRVVAVVHFDRAEEAICSAELASCRSGERNGRDQPQKARETKTLVAVHGWAGAVLGLLLYAVIVTGTAAVFANEIKAWSGGLLGTREPLGRPLNALLARLEAETPEEL